MNLNTLSVKSYSNVAITNAWDASRGLQIDIDIRGSQAIFFGNLQGLFVNFDTITTGQKVTLAISKDAAGDNLIIPDTDATLAYGKTTVSNGAAVWKFDIDSTITDKKVYLHFKTDSGTANIFKTKLVYRRLG